MNLLLTTILITILFSAFFSGIEIAFVSSNKIRLELDKQRRNITSRILELFYKHSEQFLSTMLVGNNIALVIYGMSMATLLKPVLAIIYDNEVFILLAQTILSTLLILVTGEFIPKTIFRINPNMLLRFFAAPLYLFYLLLYPLSKTSSILSKGLLRLGGVKLPKTSHSTLLSKIDLDFFIQQSIDDAQDNSELDNEVIIFQNALEFSNIKVRDCMIPRTDIAAIDIDTCTSEELIARFTSTGFSKILLYHDNIDDIVGYIHSSEMFKNREQWREQIHPIKIIPETFPAQKLMKELLKEKKSTAIVVDEFGGTSGMVTLEDLVEEICGEIEDEHDNKKYIAREIAPNEYEISGRIEISQLNELLPVEVPESDDYMTLAGYILFHYQTIPKAEETIEIDNFTFKVVKTDGSKIDLVHLIVEKK